jgi:hypothetical protein
MKALSSDTGFKFPTATPSQMIEAWYVAVMHGTPEGARADMAEWAAPEIPDPIYHGYDRLGWRSASGITNEHSIARMRSYLRDELIVAPPAATEQAWRSVEARAKARRTVARTVEAALTAAQAAGAGSVEDFAAYVADAVTALDGAAIR